jgi:methionine-rich copper-binding protein CopC
MGVQVGPHEVDLSSLRLRSGMMSMLDFLNAYDLSYVHAHPMAMGEMMDMSMNPPPTPENGPSPSEMMLHLALREPGAYKLWLQFRGGIFAHTRSKTMAPAANSTVRAPSEVYFTEPLEPKLSSLKLTDEKGTVLNKALSSLDPADRTHLTLMLPTFVPGVYHVHWVSAATDGHRMEGDYPFTVKYG